MIGKKKGIIAEARWIDWNYMAATNNPIFIDAINICTELRIKGLMGFRHRWKTEVIAQFFATVAFEENESTKKMHWMTEGTRYNISFTNFTRLLGLSPSDMTLPCIHNGTHPLDAKEIRFMYPRNKQASVGYVADLYTYYSILNRLFRMTLTPRGGHPSDVSNYAKDLLAQTKPLGDKFCVGDFLWEEIKNISESPQRLCGYAPYIMLIIEKVTKMQFLKDARHEPLRIKVPNKIRAPSLGRYDEIQVEEEGEQQQPLDMTKLV